MVAEKIESLAIGYNTPTVDFQSRESEEIQSPAISGDFSRLQA